MLRKAFDKIEPAFTDGGPLRLFYPVYEAIDTFLFSDSIRENLAFGFADSRERRDQLHDVVERAADTARILPEIERLPEGLDSLLGR